MKQSITMLLALFILCGYATAQTAASCSWPLNPTTTVRSTATGSVSTIDETIGSYFTSDVSFQANPARQTILLNHGGVGTTLDGAHANGGYVEFRVTPLPGQVFTVKSLNLNMGGDYNSFKSSIEYSVNPKFTNPTVLATPSGIFPEKNKMYPLSYTLPSVLLSPGQTLYLRIYGSHTQTAARRMLISNVVIGGTITPDAGNVSVVDNGSTVTMNNGIVSVVVTKETGEIHTFNYEGANVLLNGSVGGKIYWSWNQPKFQLPSGCTYTLTANGNNYAEIKLHMPWSGSASKTAMDLDIYYSLRRNVSGLYATAKMTHPASYPENPGGEFRIIARVGAAYNWMTVDSARNRIVPSTADMKSAVPVPNAPGEVVRLTRGNFKNMYECKYDYSADFGENNTWGWSSTTNNTGIWMTAPSKEYYPGGPMKRELLCHAPGVLMNMVGGTHYAMGSDGNIAAGEEWSKIYGPFLIYCNKVPKGTPNVPGALWADAKEQALAEQAKWPYTWLTDPAYVKAAGRGKVSGKLVINDAGATPSVANMWVGLAKMPTSSRGITDFQQWSKNFQFWVKTDAGGNFTLQDVVPGTYNLYAFGSGVIGQLTLDNYATVTAGTTTALGTVTWTPERMAPTVWEIGTPDRTSKEFKHGDDYWNQTAIYPDTLWANFLKYKTEFPNDVNYTIGTSTPSKDWNYVQPYNIGGVNWTNPPEWKVNFNLANAPTEGTNSSLYVAVASAYGAAMYVKVNGTNITTPTSGIGFPNPSNATIRMANHGAFGDYRFNFPSSLLVAGNNVITFTSRRSGGDIQYDYLRLESPGTSVTTSSTPSTMEQPKPLLTVANSINKAFAYPNPANSNLNVQFTASKTGTVQCDIVNAGGATVKRFKVEVLEGKNLLMADISSLGSGVYVIRINTGKQIEVIKFVKQ